MRMLAGIVAPPSRNLHLYRRPLPHRPSHGAHPQAPDADGCRHPSHRRPRPHDDPRPPSQGDRLRYPDPLRAGQDRRSLRRSPGRGDFDPIRGHPHPRPLRAGSPRLRGNADEGSRRRRHRPSLHPPAARSSPVSKPPFPAISPRPPSSSAPRFSSRTRTSSSIRSG